MSKKLLAIPFKLKPNRFIVIPSIIGILVLSSYIFFFYKTFTLSKNITVLSSKNGNLEKDLRQIKTDYTKLKNEDQYKRNEMLQKEINDIVKTYKKTVDDYENVLKLDADKKLNEELQKLLAQSLTYLSNRNYASGEATLAQIDKKIADEQAKRAANTLAQGVDLTNVPQSNTAPNSGFSVQRVSTSLGDFLVDIVAADLSSTKVIIDTASDSTCTNDCPVLSLGDYVSRSGAFAGVNGSYFCPASYPSCAGKTNSFDTLLMNKNKVYFNSDNNVYSTVPVVAFSADSARFMGRSSDWGRDTGVDGVIANQPLLLSGGNIAFGGDGDPKKGSKGSRSFVASKGSTVYIGVVQNATVAEVAYVLKAMGIENALNLDSGGSTALWSGGYKVGPGRNIPNAILFVRR